MALLFNRTWDVEGTWYAPQEFLADEFRSVVRTELRNTTSSAGDWDGYFVQKHGSRYYLMCFWQENLIGSPCFRMTTANHALASFTHEPTKQECDDVLNEWERATMERTGAYQVV